MDLPLDEHARRVLDAARAAAADRGDAAIAGEHVLAALFRLSAPARRVVEAVGLDADRLATQLLEQARPPAPRPRDDSRGAPPVDSSEGNAEPKAAESDGPDTAALEGTGATAPGGLSGEADAGEPQPTSQTRRLLALAQRLATGGEASGVAGERELILAAAQEPRGPFARALQAAKVSNFALRKAAVLELDGEAAAAVLVDLAERRKAREAEQAAAPPAGRREGEQSDDGADAAGSAGESAGGDAELDPEALARREARRAERQAAKAAAREARAAARAAREAAGEGADAAPAPERGPKAEREAAKATVGAEPAPRREAGRKEERKDERGADRKGGKEERRERSGQDRRQVERAGSERRHGSDDRRGGAEAAPAAPAKVPSIGRIAPEPPRLPIGWREVALLAVPASIVLVITQAGSDLLLFLVTCIAVLPLAGYMGEATEHLAARTNPTVGGLLNATFGNAAELIIAAVALRSGYTALVKASLIGSILGNLLLILGLAIVAGGVSRQQLRFNRTGVGMSAGMLALAVVGLVFPALLHAVRPDAAARMVDELHLSEVTAGILLVTYLFSLLFTLKTHQRLLGGEPHPSDGPLWSTRKALGILAVATGFVAWESEILVHAVEGVVRTAGLPEAFLGLVVVPLIGNASEHAAAISVARKGKMDLAFQIALGSSTQIALLVAPLLVFLGLAFGQRMDLVFTPFEVAALGLSVIVASIVTLDGESHWFEGVQLLAVYLLVAAAAFFL